MAVDFDSLSRGTTSGADAIRAQGLTDAKNIDQTKSQFLQLLITQLKNQDPLAPADTDQMTAQMMSLGQLEQLFDLNQNMSNLLHVQSSTQLATFSSMVGKKALAGGDVFEIKDADKGTMYFSMSQLPDSTKIRVFDRYKNLVREIPTDIQYPGFQEIKFDGLAKNGESLADGFYTYTVEALDKDEAQIPVNTFSMGTISSIRIENGQPIFLMGDNDVDVNSIERVF